MLKIREFFPVLEKVRVAVRATDLKADGSLKKGKGEKILKRRASPAVPRGYSPFDLNFPGLNSVLGLEIKTAEEKSRPYRWGDPRDKEERIKEQKGKRYSPIPTLSLKEILQDAEINPEADISNLKDFFNSLNLEGGEALIPLLNDETCLNLYRSMTPEEKQNLFRVITRVDKGSSFLIRLNKAEIEELIKLVRNGGFESRLKGLKAEAAAHLIKSLDDENLRAIYLEVTPIVVGHEFIIFLRLLDDKGLARYYKLVDPNLRKSVIRVLFETDVSRIPKLLELLPQDNFNYLSLGVIKQLIEMQDEGLVKGSYLMESEELKVLHNTIILSMGEFLKMVGGEGKG